MPKECMIALHNDPLVDIRALFPRPSTPNLEVLGTKRSAERVGAGISFRPLKASFRHASPGRLWLAWHTLGCPRSLLVE